MKNIYIFLIILLYLYLIITSIYINDIHLIKFNIIFITFILIKWIYNYRKCTLSYIECKIRCIKKQESYIYNFCDFFGDLIYSKYNDILLLILLLLYIINIIRLIIKYNRIYNTYNIKI